MSETQITRPTEAEVSAAEQVIAEGHDDKPDGYWRQVAEDALEAARQTGEGS